MEISKQKILKLKRLEGFKGIHRRDGTTKMFNSVSRGVFFKKFATDFYEFEEADC